MVEQRDAVYYSRQRDQQVVRRVRVAYQSKGDYQSAMACRSQDEAGGPSRLAATHLDELRR